MKRPRLSNVGALWLLVLLAVQSESDHPENLGTMFKVVRIGMLWDKAVRLFGQQDSRMAELRRELERQDAREAPYRDGKRVSGISDNLVEKQFLTEQEDIMLRYGLIGRQPIGEDDLQNFAIFNDQLLRDLFQMAVGANVDNDTLRDLKDGFHRQQARVNELSYMMKDKQLVDLLVNTSKLEDQTRFTSETLEDIRAEVKNLNSEIQEGYQRLLLSFSNRDGFTEPSIFHTWELVQRLEGLDGDTKDRLRRDLEYLENRLRKYTHYREKAASAEREFNTAKELFGAPDEEPEFVHYKRKGDQLLDQITKLTANFRRRVVGENAYTRTDL